MTRQAVCQPSGEMLLNLQSKSHNLPSAPGTYVFLLSLSKSKAIKVGKLGSLSFACGWYAYVGSAMAQQLGAHCIMSRDHLDSMPDRLPKNR